MRRREFLGGASLVALTLAFSALLAHDVEAQQPQPYRLGFISPATASSMGQRIEAFRKGLRELGYLEGQDVIIE